MKSYKVRAMVEIEVLVHFNQDPRFEGPFEAAQEALSQIKGSMMTGASVLNSDCPALRLTGMMGSVVVTALGTDGGSSYG